MTLLDVSGQSRARALLCTPSGRMLYSAEGGTVTVIDMYDESAQAPAYYDANMQALDGNKRFDLGSMGVLASKMVLDPAAADPPVGGGADWIYVAGGRDGLWAVADNSGGIRLYGH